MRGLSLTPEWRQQALATWRDVLSKVPAVKKRYLAFFAALAWVHGATVSLVFEGERGLLNRIVMTVVMALAPLPVAAQSPRWRRLCVSCLYVTGACYVMACSVALSWYRNPKHLPPLPDVLHDVLFEWSDVHLPSADGPHVHIEGRAIPDIFIALHLVTTVGLVAMDRRRVTILRRFLCVYGTLMLMRSVTVIATSLPDASLMCRESTPDGDMPSGAATWASIGSLSFRQVLIKSIKIMVPLGELTCGDMVFSGHSMILVLCAMTWHTYYKRTSGEINVVKTLYWTMTWAGLLTIVWTRLHYTLDVVLAVYFSITLWNSYHRIAADVVSGHKFSAVWLIDDLLIYPAVGWLEEEETCAYRRAIGEWSPSGSGVGSGGEEDDDDDDDEEEEEEE